MKFDPLISIKLNHANREYQPGDLLECEYQVDDFVLKVPAAV